VGQSTAEIVRTLASGRLPAALTIGGGPRGSTVRHAIDRQGRPLLLSRRGDVLDGLRGAGGVRVRLNVADVPPVSDAPSYGRAVVAGRARPLSADDAMAIIDEFAEANPVSGLFDLGKDVAMFAIDVESVRLVRDDVTTNVSPSEYAGATPDPLHEAEADLLNDLADHHAPQVESFIRHVLCGAGVEPAAAPRPVRLDRYGFLVDMGGTAKRWARLEFARTVRDQHDLAHLLHQVLFHGHCCCGQPTAEG
jgi:hypothetical protein